MSPCIPIGEISVAAGTELPDRIPLDHYPTPDYTVLSAYHKLLELTSDYPVHGRFGILDPGAGDGIWGQIAREMWPKATIYGVELREVKQPTAYDLWDCPSEFVSRSVRYQTVFELVVGNPPFASAEEFIVASLERLRPGGWLMFLLREGFVGSQKRQRGLFKTYPYCHKAIATKRPKFYGTNSKPIEYAVFYWLKGWNGLATESRLRSYSLMDVKEYMQQRWEQNEERPNLKPYVTPTLLP